MSHSDIEDRMGDREAQQRTEADNRRHQSLMLAVAMGKRLAEEDLFFLYQRARRRVIDAGHYLHVGSGKLYRVVGVALSEADLSAQVVYQQFSEIGGSVFIRPLDDFLAKFQHVIQRKVWSAADTGEVVETA